MQTITGGVTAAKGFTASGVHCGIRRNTGKKDLALILADTPCTAAAVYTTNKVKAAPIYITKQHIADGKAQAILANSGNANACAPNGEANAIRACEALAAKAGIKPEDIIVNSTGVIGQPLPIEYIENAIPALVAGLHACESECSGSDDAAAAIMTTDTVPKQTAVRFSLGGHDVTIGAIAKGSGMIHPNMATMLCFITTDCAIQADLLQSALTRSVNKSFNRISVDGDMSTNDMTAIMASGLAENPTITDMGDDYEIFYAALEQICVTLAKMIARDGEGATKLITCRVTGAASEEQAVKLSRSVTSSNLVKAAMTGADANWGREMCAMGYAGVDFDPAAVDIFFASDAGFIAVCENGLGLPFDEELAKTVLSAEEVLILCALKNQPAGAVAYEAETYGCDLTCEYVRINGDYRS